MKNVFIIGSRGYTKNYGGWETFVHGLLDNWKDNDTKFYVFEITNDEDSAGVSELNGIICITLYIKQIDSTKMMRFDYAATKYAYEFVKSNQTRNVIFFYLGLRIGPIIYFYRKKLHNSGIVLIENPAGLEWKRTKWNKLVQIYSWISAHMMALAVDYLVCDSQEIRKVYEKVLHGNKPVKKYIAYGTYPLFSEPEETQKVVDFCDSYKIIKNQFFLVIGRFVPENNYEMILKGFLASKTKCKLVIVCNYETENQEFLKRIESSTDYKSDSRINMVGAIYSKDIIDWLRFYAVGYVHGHSVGGTNPGLLEALSATKVNLLYDVCFNREVGGNCAFYFKNHIELSNLIDVTATMDNSAKELIGKRAKERMIEKYSWKEIVERYQSLFKEIYNK